MNIYLNSRSARASQALRIAACLAVLASCAVATQAKAEIRIPPIFGDHMILQAEVTAPVFGWADPGQEVTVAFAAQVKQAVADKDGRWIVRFEGFESSCEGRSLVIQTGGKQAKDDRLELKDVLVGEVWLASGQSNMAMNVYKAAVGPKAIENSRSNLVRVFRVGPTGTSPLKPLDNCEGAWAPATPESVRDLSAVGYFFIRGLHDELNVPVGLISSAWGGTKCEAWTSREAMLNNPVTRPTWEAFMASIQAFDPATATPSEEAKRLIDEYHTARQKTIETKSRRPPLPTIVSSPATKRYTPANFYNTMIHPLVPFGIRGVVWYQGESDRFEAERYQTAFPVMISDWRDRWERTDMSFYFVQLANINAPREEPGESVWAQQQWAQLLAHRNTPNTGIAVINDGSDVTLHPKHKKVVGDRLLCWALAKTYGHNDVAYAGPIYKQFGHEGDKICVYFEHPEGLTTRDGRPLVGFQIAGANRNWVWADAEIDGETVVVSSPTVSHPVAVRYAWAGNPGAANLTNRSGIPASLFKTDEWPPLGDGGLLPVRTGRYVHVYRSEADIYPGPSTERLIAGKKYDDWTPNDHTIIRGRNGRWHAIGITHPSVDSPPWHEGENLSFHAASPEADAGKPLSALLQEHDWKDLPKVLPPRDRPDEKPQHHAPYIVRNRGQFWMIYGPNPIRYAVSDDLMKWEPKGVLFTQENGGRDPSLFRHDGKWVVLLTSQHSVVARTSEDLLNGSDATTIFTMPDGKGAPESASMVQIGDDFYLFYCPWDPAIDDAYQHRTYVVMSDNPFDFHGRQPVAELEGHAPEIFHDVNGDWYISSVEWPHRGVSIAPLDWRLRELNDASEPLRGRSADRMKRGEGDQ